jgi:hypothetical protein
VQDWPPASAYESPRTGRIPLLAAVFAIGLALFIRLDPPQP